MDGQGEQMPVREIEVLESTQDPGEQVGEMEEEVNEGAVAAEFTGVQSSDASHVVAAAEPAMPAYMQLIMAEMK